MFCLNISLCTTCVPGACGVKKRVLVSLKQVKNGTELSCGRGELKPGPLQVQQAPLVRVLTH